MAIPFKKVSALSMEIASALSMEIATPVCALVRNDNIDSDSRLAMTI